MEKRRTLGATGVPDIGSMDNPVVSPYGLPAYREDGFWYFQGYSMSGDGSRVWGRVTNPINQHEYDKMYTSGANDQYRSRDDMEKDSWAIHSSNAAKAKEWGGAIAHPLSVAEKMAETLKKKYDFYETAVLRAHPGSDKYIVYYRKKSTWGGNASLQSLHNSRSPRSREADERLSNSLTVSPDDPRVDRWKRDPGSMDVEGVDTPKTKYKPSRKTRKTKSRRKPDTSLGTSR